MAGNYLFKEYEAEDYVAIAEETARWIKTTEKITPFGKRWEQSPDSEEDFSDYPMLTEKALYGGSAGVGLFYLRLYQVTGKEEYLLEAKAAAADIIATDEGKAFYENTLEHTKGTVDKLVHVKNMPGWKIGYYNGPTGSAYLVLKLYEVTGEKVYKDYVVKDAAAYIQGIAVGDGEAVLVPYLDSLERGPSTEFYYLGTCHGPAGTALLFEALYTITKEKEYLDWVRRLSRGIIKAGAPENYSRGYWRSQALCCGTPGLLEHFISVYKLTGEEEFLNYAKRTARTVIGQSHVDDRKNDIYKADNSRRWLGNWWRTIPQDVHSYSGLYIGTAGNAWSLLSLAGVLKNEKYIELVEYNYQ